MKKYWLSLPCVLVLTLAILGCSQPAPAPAAPPAAAAKPAAPSSSAPAPAAVAPPSATAVPSSAAAPAAKVIQLKFAHNVPNVNYIHAEAIAPWGAELEKRTNGRVKVTIFPSETLGKLIEYYDMVMSGGTDCAMIIPSYMAGRFPLCDIFNLPYFIPGAPDDPQAIAVRRTLFDKYFSTTIFKDVKILWSARFAANSVSTVVKPIRTITDIKGMVIGSSAGRNLVEMMKLVGASVQSFNPGDMYTALERKTVDGVMLPLEGSVGWKIHEVTKYTTMINAGAGPFFMAMNQGVYKNMPADIQKTVDDLNPWADDAGYKAAAKAGQNAVEVFKKAGVEVIELSAAERAKWVDASKPIDDAWIKDTDGKGFPASRIYGEVKDMLAKK